MILGGVHVPPGYRAVAVRIDEGSGVDYHLEPGSHVDVVGYFKVRKRGQQETIARTLIENVEVAAVGARISAVAAEEEAQSGRPTRAVTLLVQPDQVPILHLAEQQGKIKLSLRGDEDFQSLASDRVIREEEVLTGQVGDEEEEQEGTPGLGGWFAGLFGQERSEPEPQQVQTPVMLATAAPAIQPGPPPVPEWVVYVWRGQKQEIVRFKSRDSRERVGEGSESSAPATPGGAQPQANAIQPAGQSNGQAATAGQVPETDASSQEQEGLIPEESLE